MDGRAGGAARAIAPRDIRRRPTRRDSFGGPWASVGSGSRYFKSIFTGPATTVLTQLVDHPLHAECQRRLQNKPNLAKHTLARRIAAIVLSMWKHEEVDDRARLKVVTEKP